SSTVLLPLVRLGVLLAPIDGPRVPSFVDRAAPENRLARLPSPDSAERYPLPLEQAQIPTTMHPPSGFLQRWHQEPSTHTSAAGRQRLDSPFRPFRRRGTRWWPPGLDDRQPVLCAAATGLPDAADRCAS